MGAKQSPDAVIVRTRLVQRSAWVARAVGDLDQLLLDHAHCEKKAASSALSLLFKYADRTELLVPVAHLAREELVHFEQVLAQLRARGVPFAHQVPGPYARELTRAVRAHEPERLVDTLLCMALIEARSCERLALLADALDDPALAGLYRSLLASEARHHTTYVELAATQAPAADVRARLAELARARRRGCWRARRPCPASTADMTTAATPLGSATLPVRDPARGTVIDELRSTTPARGGRGGRARARGAAGWAALARGRGSATAPPGASARSCTTVRGPRPARPRDGKPRWGHGRRAEMTSASTSAGWRGGRRACWRRGGRARGRCVGKRARVNTSRAASSAYIARGTRR